MDIGEEKKKVTVEPIVNPVKSPEPEHSPEPERHTTEPQPEPVRTGEET